MCVCVCVCAHVWNVCAFVSVMVTYAMNDPTPRNIPCTCYLAKIKFWCLQHQKVGWRQHHCTWVDVRVCSVLPWLHGHGLGFFTRGQILNHQHQTTCTQCTTSHSADPVLQHPSIMPQSSCSLCLSLGGKAILAWLGPKVPLTNQTVQGLNRTEVNKAVWYQTVLHWTYCNLRCLVM